MGKFVGFMLFLLGLALLGFGLAMPGVLFPQTFGAVLWKVVLGLLLTVGGYLMAEYSGGGGALSAFMAVLLALLGLTLLAVAVLPALFGVPLFTTGAIIFRVALGLLFCVLAFLAREFSG
jgi:hypothetical protein